MKNRGNIKAHCFYSVTFSMSRSVCAKIIPFASLKEIKITVVLQGCIWQCWNTCSREEILWPFLENKVAVAHTS